MHRVRLRDLATKLWRRSITSGNLLVYGPDVVAAQEHGSPVVALESTIITHGMPYPANVNTALRVENMIRKQGAVPATIGIINGKIHVGLNKEQLEILARADATNTIKCSRRDISFALSNGLNGGTTVSGTMLIAQIANIPIMATGGIGGVHRGAEQTLDISADLIEFGRTPVAVVCSGVKSILDIAKTLEYLETQGVPIIKIGDTPEFPAFYCAETHDKIKAPCRVSTAKEAADIVETQRTLNVKTGILFAVPIPKEYALQPSVVDTAISDALKKASIMHITGKEVTPFLLNELNEITRGQSLEANIALIENNAKVAAEIALHLCEKFRTAHIKPASVRSIISKQKPVVIGASILDTVLQVKEPEINNSKPMKYGRTNGDLT
ncbi:hypothetical protein PUN28_016429 [Cardiocondyla obscurior]|uniref:Pseudouridine-5'-phosphate glycosidase n=1 Tax=Cardiocondyla obscurior TaxID=286306 RepID=A0AAW2EPS2_9HYME